MKRLLTFAGILLAFFSAQGQDKDTIPLLQKTTTPQAGDTLEADPLVARKPSQKDTADTRVDVGNGSTGPQEPKPYVASLDTFGSSRINAVALRAFLGQDLAAELGKIVQGNPESLELETKLLAKVKQKWGFAAADWSVMEYFQPGDLPIHITLDVVEKEDVVRRMPFLPAPTAQFRDPDGLIKAWMDYEEIALDLVEAGAIEPEAVDCPAFHCPFGHKHPKLKKYGKIFVEGVRKDATELAEIQAKDRRPEYRAAATYLLAYLKDGKKVVSLMVSRIKDPDAMVRNNALRVLGDIAEYHPDLLIPIRPVLEALHFPRVSDRSKAIYVAYLAALNSEQARDEILRSAVPDLLLMMQSKQPDHQELSQAILRRVSGKDYAATDVQAWSNWYNHLPRQRLPSAR